MSDTGEQAARETVTAVLQDVPLGEAHLHSDGISTATLLPCPPGTATIHTT